MEGSVAHSYLTDILHAVSQALLAPDIILLLVFIGYALFSIGSVIAEYFTERRYFQVTMPKFLSALMAAEEDGIPAVIEESGLLKRQKVALLTVYDYRTLPGDALVALIRRVVSEEESRYDRVTNRNSMAARVAPMLGLMGTLIPLGPGIQALGQADTAALSSSLLVAFDTTVAGLVVAAVCLVVGKIRSMWYSNYMSALDSAMATMLQKIEDMRAEGKIETEEPTNYAFLYEQTSARSPKPVERSEEKLPRRTEAEGITPKTDFKPTRATQPLSQAAASQSSEDLMSFESFRSMGAADQAGKTDAVERAGNIDALESTASATLFPREGDPAPTVDPASVAEPAPKPSKRAFPRPVFMTPPASGTTPAGQPTNQQGQAQADPNDSGTPAR